MACAAPLRPRSLDDSKLASLMASTSLAVVSQSVAETLELQPDAPSPRAKPLSRSSSAEQLLAVSSGDDTARSDEVRRPVTLLLLLHAAATPAGRDAVPRRARLGPRAGALGRRLRRRGGPRARGSHAAALATRHR
jgi:hypothetical protein